MSVVCFICNSSSELIESYNYNSTLGSGKTFQEVIAEILGESAARQTITARPLCSKCYERCVEYHGLWARLTRLKKELQATFLRPKIPTVTRQTLTRDSPKKMVCLPASKLKPVPPQYLFLNKSDLNTGKLTTPVKLQPKPMAITSSPKSTVTAVSLQTTPTKTTPVELATITKQPPTKNLTIDTSVLLSQLSEVKSNLTDELADITAVDESRKVTMPSSIILSSNTSSSILHFDVNNLPKDFLDNAVLSRTIEEENDAQVENNDEQPMEIDEDCSFTAPKNTEIPDSSTHQQEETANPSDEGTERHNVLEMSMLPDLDPVESQHGADYDQDGGEDDQDGADDDQDGGDDEDNGDEEYVVKKVEILDEEDDENTLLVQGEDGSLIRVMAGQKFLYGGNEISLIIPQDGDNDDTMDNNDNADSNDESHIELQVSGDEETANAIIAAAQEQGGAFIKVQSGEMYRVKSVKSKIETVSEEEKAAEPAKRFSDVVKKMGNCYKCVICMKELKSGSRRTYYQSREAAARHVRVTHRIDVHAPDKQTRLVSSDGTELPTPSKKGGHECAECGKSFGSRNLLMEHMNQHTGTRPYACPKCGKTFASKYTYQAHLKTHEERLRLFRCSKDGCSKSFYTLQNLSQHEHTHEGIKSFKCQVCNKSFGTAHNLEVHGVVHSGLKPFSCSMCDKSFARKAEIRDHIRTHTGERPFACEICGATFAQRSNLQSHVRATHTQDKRHACEHCDKKFKRRRLLEYHIKACHTGERPFRCEVCNATFVYPEHYKKHAWIHSGERPFVCEVCGKSFNSRDNRNAHRFVHSDKKPYECLVCGAGYMRKPLLYAHMHTSGHMTESIVVNQPRVSVDDEPDSSALQFFETVNEAELELGDRKVKTVVSQEEDGIAKVYISSADGNNIKSENSAINLIEDSDTALITIAQNLEGSSKIEPSILASLANEELGKGAEIVANDENGGVIRLVQIQLPNGDNGWIAIN